MIKKKTFSFGACNIANYSPKKETFDASTKVLNIRVSFEEALKLNLALDECIRKLNEYNRSTSAGKRAAVNLAIYLNKDRITVVEGKI